jgi:Na+/proline symporter
MIAGMTAASIVRLINAAEYEIGLTDVRYNQIASSIFFSENKLDTFQSKLLGGIINNINTGFVGVLLCYVLSATGRDKFAIKGMGIGAFSWLMVNGVFTKFVAGIKSKKPLAPILSLFDHVFAGLIGSTIIVKLGADKLFPDTNKESDKRLPLVATGSDSEQKSSL